jgi:hypothetical protein
MWSRRCVGLAGSWFAATRVEWVRDRYDDPARALVRADLPGFPYL